ncbi:MAG: hypothetical protein IJ515_03925 [Clostridia bacterium]|nr:hypothetical protein [Clostridia bacterium]
MKIAILGFTKISYMPYLHFYLNQIDLSANDVHLIYWQRDEKPDAPVPDGVTGHALAENMDDSIPLKSKLPKLNKYRRFAIKKLKQLRPDFLIILHSTTGITVLDYIKRHYKGRYILDYRDVTYERNKYYKGMVATLVNCAAITFTSSDGFRKFLPEGAEILTSHNLTRDVLEAREQHKIKTPSEKIRIAFWGLLRHHSLNEKIVSALADDPRFELHFYGRAQGKMLELVESAEKEHTNIFFHGEYRSADRIEFAKCTDILHNLYDNSDKTTPIAMGNKYYDGVIFYIPQLCMPGSLMAEMSARAGVGFACDPAKEGFADGIYAYYQSIDRESFFASCDKELSRILKEVESGEQKIKEVLENAAKEGK